MKINLVDKNKDLSEKINLTRSSRIKDKVKYSKMSSVMSSVKKNKKITLHTFPVIEPFYLAGEDGYEYPDDGDVSNEESKY